MDALDDGTRLTTSRALHALAADLIVP